MSECPRPRPRVLLVDDEPRIVASLSRVIGRLAPELDTAQAHSAEEALDVLAMCEVATIVTDVHMPGRDGFWLLEQVRHDPLLRGIPVVVLTGTGEHAIKRRALDLGANDLLAKPIAPADLVARIRASLRLKHSQDALVRQAQQLETEVRARTTELERAWVELVWRLGVAGEYRDNQTGNHVVRVGYYARTLGEHLGLDHAACERLFLAAPLHDIGKIAIPDRILLKPGPLLPDEWSVMMTHARIGAEILRRPFVDPRHAFDLLPVQPEPPSPLIDAAAAIAAHHHERWDGTGYPDRLAGDAIPLEARIVAVADVFDALSTRRPYKPAFEPSEVYRVMKRGDGSQFDPEVFAAFEAARGQFADIARSLRDPASDPVKLPADRPDPPQDRAAS